MEKKNYCKNPVIYRYAWPGKDEAYICAIHAVQLHNLAQNIGLHLQFNRVSMPELLEQRCSQEVKQG